MPVPLAPVSGRKTSDARFRISARQYHGRDRLPDALTAQLAQANEREAALKQDLAILQRAAMPNAARRANPVAQVVFANSGRRVFTPDAAFAPGIAAPELMPNTTLPPPCPVQGPGRSTRSMAWPNSNCARTAWQSRWRILPGSSARWQDPPSITTRRRGSRNPAPWRPAPLPRPARPGFASRHFAGPHILVVLK